jgi:hypothetical protein
MKHVFKILAMTELILLSVLAQAGNENQEPVSQPMQNSIQQEKQAVPMIQAGLLTDQASIQKIYAMVKKPTTPLELLKNFRFALEHDFLVRPDFYNKENFERFFGGRAHIQISESPEEDKYYIKGKINDLENILSETKKYGISTIGFQLRYENQKKLYAIFYIPGTFSDSRMTVELVKNVIAAGAEMKVFQRNDSISEEGKIELMKNYHAELNHIAPAPFTGYYSPTTNDLGNKKINFIFPEEKTRNSIDFITSGSGQIINYINVNQTEK